MKHEPSSTIRKILTYPYYTSFLCAGAILTTVLIIGIDSEQQPSISAIDTDSVKTESSESELSEVELALRHTDQTEGVRIDVGEDVFAASSVDTSRSNSPDEITLSTHDDTNVFTNVQSYDSSAIETQIENSKELTENILNLVRTELAQPRTDIGKNLIGVESTEVRHARKIIETVQEFEAAGIAVSIDELTYVPFSDDLSAGIFGDSKKLEMVSSEKDDYGNERLAMAVIPDESVSQPISLKTPVSAGFSIEIISSTREPYWTDSSNGKVKGQYVKYRDFGERDPEADYYAYQRWSEARPASTFWGGKRYVKSADLKSGVTNTSAWKVLARIDQEPWHTQDAGGAVCDNTTLEVNVGVVTLGQSGQWCDEIEPRWVWGGLHTRYTPNRTLAESIFGNWSSHTGKQIRNNFMVTMSVKAGTEPYWWDYTDAYFCSEATLGCSEPYQY